MKFRKIILIAFSLVFTVNSIGFPFLENKKVSMISAFAEDVPLNPGIQYENCGDHIEITGYDGTFTYYYGIYLEIPETIEGLPVTKICAGACKDITKMYLLSLPMTVEEIGDEAFAGCSGLVVIHFPTSLRTIGKRAFYGCKMRSLTLPESVTEIGEEAFAKCEILKYANLPDTLRTIKQGTFADDDIMSMISIPASVERIESHAFAGCEKLNTICYKGSADAWSVLSVGNGNENLLKATILCDYNKQKVDRNYIFDPEKDTWSFSNKDLEYYSLSEESIEEMTSGMNITDQYQIQNYWNETEGYNGACLGFAITSMLAAAGILDPSELDPDAKCLHDVKLTDEVRELITYYWVVQGTDAFKESDIRTSEKWDYYLEQGIPVLFWYGGFYYNEEGKNVFLGHAVVAYGVERGHFEFDGNVFTTKLLTYDSNVTTENGWDGCIYIDPENTEWKYGVLLPEQRIYVPYTAERGQASMMWFPPVENIDFINLFGKNKGVDYIAPEQKCALFRTPELPAAYKMQSYEPGRSENKSDAAYTQMKVGDFQALQCANGTKGYTLEMLDKQEIDCSMSYENWLYTVNSSDVTSAAFEPDGSLSIIGEDMQYQFAMIADEGQHPTSYYEIRFSGRNADNVSVRKTDDGYRISGTNLHEVTINALNDSKELTLTFSTDADHVLLHETDSYTLAVSADLDKDGTYETVLTSRTSLELGDVNADGNINAIDATKILISSARSGTGQNYGLMESQQNAADVNHDGTINAVDATWILRYAAAIGTGTAPKAIEEYISIQKS